MAGEGPVRLSIENVSKTYGQTHALNAVSLDVRAGEMVGLIGASGSGKSTLLRAVAGLVAADRSSGPIRLNGEVVQSGGRLSARVRRLRAQLGFIFQQFNLVERASAYTNALLGALSTIPAWRGALGLFPSDRRALAMQALAYVGLADQAGQRASDLSGGQQQRVAIARVLVQNAHTLLADEPIASLDPVSARRVMQLLHRLNAEEGLTVLVTLHQVDYALKYCSRIIALKDGRIVYDGPASELDRARLIEIYGDEYADVTDDAKREAGGGAP